MAHEDMWTECSKCKKLILSEMTYPVEYRHDNGQITIHYGCDRCINEMQDMMDARNEERFPMRLVPSEEYTFTPVQSDPLDYENHHDTAQSW